MIQASCVHTVILKRGSSSMGFYAPTPRVLDRLVEPLFTRSK